MKKSKLLTSLAILFIAIIALFTGCNKNDGFNGNFNPSSSARGGQNYQINSPVPLGTAATFAVLGGATVTNVGESFITGNAGPR